MMSRTLLSLSSCLLLISVPATASANDIIDFLRAVQGYSNPRPVPVSALRRYDRQQAHHDRHDHRDIRTAQRNIDRHYATRHRPLGTPVIPRSAIAPRTTSSFRISFGSGLQPAVPPVPVIPQAPVIAQPPVIHHTSPVVPALPHQIGDIVTCPVPIERHVVVKDLDEVAPDACPVVVAVRDPSLGRYTGHLCQERLVYVEVLVPPCPLQKLRVSPCRTKVRLDYGRYEVDIVSRNGCVEIDYDD